MIPRDPQILVSFVNTQLRDHYSNLEDLCSDMKRENSPSAERPARRETRKQTPTDLEQLDSGQMANGILEVLPDGYGFIRCENYLPGDNDVYVSPSQIRRFNLKTGDILSGNTRVRTQSEKFSALLFLKSVNGFAPAEAAKRQNFEDM